MPPRFAPPLRTPTACASIVYMLLAITCSAQTLVELAPGVYRFDADETARAAALPSLSFAEPARREQWSALTGDPPVRPQISNDPNGRQVVSIPVAEGTSLYGTGEVPGALERSGRATVLWNTDSYGYDESFQSLYQSHPWVLAVRADGASFGVLADTTYRCRIDLRLGRKPGVRFVGDGPAYPLIVFEGDSPQQVLTRLTEMIGRIELPPLWAVGYHQCRYSYYPASRAREIAKGFRDRDIPCDVIWHDIDYMDEYKVFTFDPNGYPDPKAHNAKLHEWGFHTVWMIDPGVGATEGYFVYDQLMANKHYVKTADGEPFIGHVWPGPCVFPDFTRREVRDWWAGLYKDFVAVGVDGVWNDMNEPAVFKVESKTMPLDNIHAADAELGGTGPHARYHNVYGMLMTMGTRQGLLAARPDKRPFVLSRANFIGGHRIAAVWTGDNVSNWDHLDWSIPMALNLGLSGQPFSGPDIGGFVDAGTGPMFARWMGLGALLPFARGHTGKGNPDKEPWSFGPEVEQACRLALQRRYQLIPHIYTLFYEATRSGLPVARPLFFADPADPRLREHDDSFLLGDGLLVFAHVTEDRSREPLLPRRGVWRPVKLTGHGHPDLPLMFIRGGAIVPTGPIEEYVAEKPLDPLTLLVALDENGQARGMLYEDSGEGFGYRDGDYLLTTYAAARAGDIVTVRVAETEGQRPRPQRELEVRVILPNGEERTGAGRDGEPLRVNLGG